MIDLQTAWNLTESINEKANLQTYNAWTIKNYQNAVDLQAECFRNAFLDLAKQQQQDILYWYHNDDEFQDYFKCLSNNMIIDFTSEDSM